MKKLFTLPIFGAAALIASAHPIDFEKIGHWTGNGPNEAALVVRFAGNDTQAYVWGFRWEDDENPSGEDMFRAICSNSDELIMLTQYTGSYGATLCGLGFGNSADLIEHLYFDFDMAKDYEWINFDYYNTNSWFGQADAPGDNTPAIMQAAITDAADSHIIQHPLDYFAYGYPAYDYDCWKCDENIPEGNVWQSGWYEGYWSYWLSKKSDSDWEYSGSGFSGVTIHDGDIEAWTFTIFDVPGVGGMGEGTPPPNDPALINYRAGKQTSIIDISNNIENSAKEFYTLQGLKIDATRLSSGLYIVREGSKTYKQLIK
ncbi:MAG: hypothetical protein J1F05_03085 [Muribaculaceae bacterium]|nr:hypothetical protein [Muribaculaceae bacterium]